jgi:hypothetical protein
VLSMQGSMRAVDARIDALGEEAGACLDNGVAIRRRGGDGSEEAVACS